MALPPLELFSLREKAALLPGGFFVAGRHRFARRLGLSTMPSAPLLSAAPDDTLAKVKPT
jgi:hypothetical protein